YDLRNRLVNRLIHRALDLFNGLFDLLADASQPQQLRQEADQQGNHVGQGFFNPIGGTGDLTHGDGRDGIDDCRDELQNLAGLFDHEHDHVDDGENRLDDRADRVEHRGYLGYSFLDDGG